MKLFPSAWRDLCFAARMLARSRTFTAVAVLCLALGIGANSTMFSLVDGYWLRPLPVRDPGSLVHLMTSPPRGGHNELSYAEFEDYQRQSKSFSGLVATQRRGPTLTGESFAESTMSNVVSDNYFTVLGIGAHLGRVFSNADRDSGQRVVVMGYSLWQRRFHGDPKIIGRAVRLNGSYIVVGIAPKEFRGTELWQDSDFWIPMTSWDTSGAERRSRSSRSFEVMGRLRPGVTVATARAELTGIAAQLEQAYPKSNRGYHATLMTSNEYLLQTTQSIPFLLLGIVGLVLLIACANLANLLLARAGTRAHEMGVRLAMGAPRRRLIGQLMAENVLIGALGMAAGLVLSTWLISLLPHLLTAPGDSFTHLQFRLDLRVLGFTLVMSLLTVIVFGLAPALYSTRTNLMETIRTGRAGEPGGRRAINPRNALVVVQVALSMLLLTTAGLLVRTFLYAMNADLGFQRRDVLVADVSPVYGGKREREFYRQLLERTRALPGVTDVALTLRPPLSPSGGGMAETVVIGGRPESAEPLRIRDTVIDVNYFRTIGLRLLSGRDFDAHDVAGSMPVVIVNETMARRFWPGEDALGKTIVLPEAKGREYTIVGVVNNSHVNQIEEAPAPYFYLAYAQSRVDDMYLIAATRGEPLLMAQQFRHEVAEVDKTAPVLAVTSMKLLVESRLHDQKTAATLVGTLGGIGLFLAAVGLYGLIAQFVTARTREIGIRMALGAQPRDALRMVLRRGIGLVLTGAGIGLAGSLFATRLLSRMVYGISLRDPFTFAVVIVVLVGVAALASYIPARRATRINPTAALHYE